MGAACGGGGGKSAASTASAQPASQAPAPPSPSVQTYTVRWLPSPSPGVDAYLLSLGTTSGVYDPGREIVIPIAAAVVRSDGSWAHDIQLDRSRDQFLIMRARAASLLSAPSNEIRVAALGASGPAAASATAPVGPSAASTVASLPAQAGSAPGSATAGVGPGSAGAPAAASPQAETAAPASLDFDGTDEFLATSGAATFAPSLGWSASLWGLAPAGDAGRRGLLRVACADESCALELTLAHAAGGPAFELRAFDAASEAVWTSPAPIAPETWWHLGVVFDPQTQLSRLYVDGALLAELPGAGPPAALFGAAARVTLGATGAELASPWLGLLGHAAFFERALGAAEIAEIWARGHALDLRFDAGAYQGAAALAHYWRLGAVAAAVGRDFAASPLDLDDPVGGVDAADVVAEAPGALAFGTRMRSGRSVRLAGGGRAAQRGPTALAQRAGR